jgi:hypothetical protein
VAVGTLFGKNATAYWAGLMAAVGFLALVLVILKEPRWGVYAFIAVYPLESYSLGRLGGNISPPNVVVLLCAGALVVRAALGYQPIPRYSGISRMAVLLAMPLFVIGTIPATILSADPVTSLRFLSVRVGYALTFWMTLWLIDTPERLIRCFRILMWAAAVTAMGIVLTAFFPRLPDMLPLPPDLRLSSELVGGTIDLLGTGAKTVLLFNQFVSFAAFAAFAFPMALSSAFWPETFGGTRRGSWIALTAIVGGIVLSLSRAGWVGCAVATALWFLLLPRLGARRIWQVPALLSAIFVALLVQYWDQLYALSEWMLSAQRGSVDERVAVFRVTMDVIRAHPWFGLGPMIMDRVLSAQGYHPLVHNSILVEMVYVGLVGVLPYIALIGLALWSATRAVLNARDIHERRIAAVVLLGLVAGFTIFQTTSAVGEKILWLMVALAIALSRFAQVHPRERVPDRSAIAF